MDHQNLYNQTSLQCSYLITNRYSTSFSLGIKTLHKKFQYPISAIYGFVRFADEIVDTFHDKDKSTMLKEFRADTYKAIENKFSLNPVLHAFQLIVRQYNIEQYLIDAFFNSMMMDLEYKVHNVESYNRYIYGSAEVVGLMCLKVFTENSPEKFNQLKITGQRLGAAFQKVNFLRDMKSDYSERGRVYFPDLDIHTFGVREKKAIELDIEEDFRMALQGIKKLPSSSRNGVFLAYLYYQTLFRKIKKLPASTILNERVRIPNVRKIALLIPAMIKQQLGFK